MKLNLKHIAGYVRNNDWAQKIDSGLKAVVFGKKTVANVNENIKYIFRELEREKNIRLEPKSYVLRQTALNVIDRIKLTDSFDTVVLTRTPIPYGEIVLNDRELYRFYYNTTTKTFVGWYLSTFDQHFFVLDVSTGKTFYLNDGEIHEKQISECAEHFFKCLTFLFFSDIKTVILPPKTKIGNEHEGEFKNELTHTFTIVDTNWNQISIRTEGFNVRGHFRLQPCGLNRESRKLIFIDEYQKHGYVRGAKQLREV